MVSITIDSFKDGESTAIYELPEGSSVLDLKAEIEATEGTPIRHQRLVYRKDNHQRFVYEEELQDNEDLDFLIGRSPPFQPEPTIHLLQARIYLHLKILKRQATVESYQIPHSEERIISEEVDLNETIRASFAIWKILRDAVDPSAVKLFVLNSNQDPTSISDIDQTFSYYGICNGDAMHIVYESDSDRLIGSVQQQARLCFRQPPQSDQLSVVVLQARYNWDGKIMHPFIKGLPLTRNTLFKKISLQAQAANGWLYGLPLLEQPVISPWFPFITRVEGYFPENFVSALEENTVEGDTIEITDDMLEVPPLPPFQFPPAKNMIFNMPISDKGHSFLKMTANYELLSSPVDPTHVTIKLLCSTHDIRRVSSVSLFIETPHTKILDVQIFENEVHREEIYVDKEVTESRSRQTYFDGVNFGTHGTTIGFQGGISRGYSIGSTEKGSRVSRRKVDAGVFNDNTIFWNLKAPTTRLDEDGLTGEESITFILTHKPVKFKYKCRVTHSRGGVEKTTQRVSRA